jgi:hypothetical protein
MPKSLSVLETGPGVLASKREAEAEIMQGKALV